MALLITTMAALAAEPGYWLANIHYNLSIAVGPYNLVGIEWSSLFCTTMMTNMKSMTDSISILLCSNWDTKVTKRFSLFLSTLLAIALLSAVNGAVLRVTTKALIAPSPSEQVIEPTYRGLWVWNAGVAMSDGIQNEFLTFAQLKNLTGVYLYAYALLPDHTSALGNFIDRADDIGVEVELLAGDPTWALAPNHPIALGFVHQAITFTKSITQGARPLGIHLDIEPYLLPEWTSDRANTISQYLDLLSDIQQELITSNTTLAFTVDIPFWYDTITATRNSATKLLNQHVQDIVDRVVIMDYRDFAQGDDGIIQHAQNEMTYAQTIIKEVTIGVETNDIEPEKVTFFEEGEAIMESELTIVEQNFQTNPAFQGCAIHDYSGYCVLAPIRSVYLPVVFRD